jgi:hypothetical protein
MSYIHRTIPVFLALWLSPQAWADFWDPYAPDDKTRYVQAELGSVPVEPVNPAGTEPEATASASVHTFGLVLQRAEQTGQFQYGLEGGIRLGYGSNRSMFVRLAGTGSSVEVRSDLWTGDFTFGGFFSVSVADRLRFYASSGPALYWGRASGGDRDTSVAQANGPAVTIDLTDNGDDLGVAWYARAGAEWMFSPSTHIGFSVRKLDARLDFGSRGRVHMDEPSYLVTLGYVY